MEERVNAGHKLTHSELTMLADIERRTESIKGLIDRHPEYQELYSRAVHLYHTITQRALENEKES